MKQIVANYYLYHVVSVWKVQNVFVQYFEKYSPDLKWNTAKTLCKNIYYILININQNTKLQTLRYPLYQYKM